VIDTNRNLSTASPGAAADFEVRVRKKPDTKLSLENRHAQFRGAGLHVILRG
jgi:hypothetical protein